MNLMENQGMLAIGSLAGVKALGSQKFWVLGRLALVGDVLRGSHSTFWDFSVH